MRGARVDREGCRGVNGTMRHRKASPWRLYLAAAMSACTASSRGVSSIYQAQDQCPSLASARGWGAAPHWVLAACIHLSTILRCVDAFLTLPLLPSSTLQPRADLGPLLPLQVTQSSPPSSPTAAARSLAATGTLPHPLPPPPTSTRSVEASRVRCARAVCVHMRHACTRILPLTNPY